MSWFAFGSLLAAVICFAMGLFIYNQDRSNRLNQIFTLLCIVIAYVSFTEYGYRQAESVSQAIFWMQTSAFWPLQLSLLLHFALAYTEKDRWLKRWWTYLLLYGPAVAFTIITLINGYQATDVTKAYWGWTYTSAPDSFLWYFNGTWSTLSALFALVLFWFYWRKIRRTEGIKKDQALYILFGFSIPILAAVLGDGLLPQLDIRIPELTHTSLSLGVLFIGWGIWKYKLFVLTPARAAKDIIETMSNFLFLIDSGWKISTANPAALQLLGYDQKELINQPVGKIFPGQQWETDVLQGKRPYDLDMKTRMNSETLLLTKSGKRVPVIISVSTVRERESGQLGFICVGSDITERKLAEQRQDKLLKELERSNRELSDFAYVVSHDLKAPLRGIDTLAGWVAQDYGNKMGEKAQQQMQLMRERVRRMDDLINGILRYSRAGRANEEKTSVDTRELVRQIVDLLAPPPHISIEIDGSFPQIRAEKTRLSEVFQNLISNAIKYLDKPEGTIRVACQDRDEMWVFSVADNGPGIPEKDFGRIFQLFQTLKPNEGTASTGIGLALVKKIVEGAGGRVWLESKPLQGTKFFFTWPKE